MIVGLVSALVFGGLWIGLALWTLRYERPAKGGDTVILPSGYVRHD